MDITIDGRAEAVVARLVKDGRHASPGRVIEDALSLFEREHDRLPALRAELVAALDEGGDGTIADLERDLDAVEEQLKREVF